MGKWDRLTPWRQGAILTAGATTALGLISDRTPEHTAVVVVSHDCDLAQAPDHEPTVEAIVGRFIEKPDGNYMHCKNVRCLHLSIAAGSRRCTIELEPRNRVPLLKSSDQAISLADFVPSPEFAMTQKDRRTLRRWLAARYDREAFPDEFDRRMKEETRVGASCQGFQGNRPVHPCILTLVTPCATITPCPMRSGRDPQLILPREAMWRPSLGDTRRPNPATPTTGLTHLQLDPQVIMRSKVISTMGFKPATSRSQTAPQQHPIQGWPEVAGNAGRLRIPDGRPPLPVLLAHRGSSSQCVGSGF
jgi:hypothetical protein